MTDDPEVADRVRVLVATAKGYLRQIEMFNNTETAGGRRMATTNAYALLRDVENMVRELDPEKDDADVQDD